MVMKCSGNCVSPRSAAVFPSFCSTALADPQSEEFGLSLGAADYITKPIKPVVVQARVRTQLEAKQARDGLQNQNAALETEVARRMAENDLIQQVSIRASPIWRRSATPKPATISCAPRAMRLLASALADHPCFADTLSPGYIDLLSRSAPLHDIGKVGIPDHILPQAGQADPGGVADHAHHAKLGSDAMRRPNRTWSSPWPHPGQGDRPLAPREVGWQRLPGWFARGRHTPLGPPDGAGRRV